ncbi:MAG: 50S ribosomal protein L32 [Candidatus Berkelbacteria bacterium]|nr:50S ribosomal protein L32 [Candidatus Berkelbacteria bacterium]
MAEPKKRLTRSRSGARQSHDALKEKTLIKCSNCKEPVLPHHVCPNCGFYKKNKIIVLQDEIARQKKIDKELKDE